MNVGSFDRGQIFRQDLRHRGAGHVGSFFREPAVGEVPSRMFGVCEVHVADDIDDAAVRLFRQTFVFAAVARLHMEGRDMEPLRADDGKAAVRIAKDEDGVGLEFDHRLIARRDNIAHRFAKVGADCVKIQFRIREPEVFKEDAVERIVVILPGVDQNRIEIFPRLLNDGGEPNDLRPRPDDDHQLNFSILLPSSHTRRFLCMFHIIELAPVEDANARALNPNIAPERDFSWIAFTARSASLSVGQAPISE